VLEQNVNRFNSEKKKILPYGISRHSSSRHLVILKLRLYPLHIQTAQKKTNKFKKAAIQKIVDIKCNKNLFTFILVYPSILLSFIIDYKVNKAFQVKQVMCQLKNIIGSYA